MSPVFKFGFLAGHLCLFCKLSRQVERHFLQNMSDKTFTCFQLAEYMSLIPKIYEKVPISLSFCVGKIVADSGGISPEMIFLVLTLFNIRSFYTYG